MRGGGPSLGSKGALAAFIRLQRERRALPRHPCPCLCWWRWSHYDSRIQLQGRPLRTRNPGPGTRRSEIPFLRTEIPGTGIRNPWLPERPNLSAPKVLRNCSRNPGARLAAGALGWRSAVGSAQESETEGRIPSRWRWRCFARIDRRARSFHPTSARPRALPRHPCPC